MAEQQKYAFHKVHLSAPVITQILSNTKIDLLVSSLISAMFEFSTMITFQYVKYPTFSILYVSCFLVVRIPDPWNSSLEFGLEFQGSGVATALEQHTENSMAIPPYTIKVWCQFLQNITSMLFFFQMNGVLTYLSIWKDS